VVRARMAHLDQASAKFQLIALDEREQVLEELDVLDGGNIETRLMRCTDNAAVLHSFSAAAQQVLGLVPPRVRENTQQVVLSSSEVAYRLFGLEYARARVALKPNSFSNKEEIVFGAGPYERELTDDTPIQFAELMVRVAATRHQHGNRNDPLFRMAPERWLESLVTAEIRSLDQQLDPRFVYSQVPAFAAGDRAMIDVLAATQSRRLAVIELKADEDIHLPLQGLDYWARVEWHQQRGEFQKFGYFPGVELSPERPMLMLVAPALHVHPATDTLLRYLSPKIDWNLIALDEHWREGIRVLFRRSRQSAQAARHS
jgi:hypothetical protein